MTRVVLLWSGAFLLGAFCGAVRVSWYEGFLLLFGVYCVARGVASDRASLAQGERTPQ